jgi:hypothetical protein
VRYLNTRQCASGGAIKGGKGNSSRALVGALKEKCRRLYIGGHTAAETQLQLLHCCCSSAMVQHCVGRQ